MILLGSIQRYELERMILKQLAMTPELKKAIADARRKEERFQPEPVSVDVAINMIDSGGLYISHDDNSWTLKSLYTMCLLYRI